MSKKVFNRAIQVGGESKIVNSVTIRVFEYDQNNLIVRAEGTTVPTDGSTGYAKGCTFVETDATGNVVRYVNEGSATSCAFNQVDSGETVTLTPDDSEGTGVNVIPAGVSRVSVGANVNDTNDYIVLPALSSVPNGFEITVISNAAGHEVRTPAASAEEINSEDCDGTKEYAIASGNQIHRFTKIDGTIGWMGQGFTAIGAVVTAVVPD